ncbi:unnamed protein product [Thlaspi arvense]|uniref:Uncharacterized protein n=1 Tax=Thlaspi arvense TaxID=13288 RepID=A0AAU9SPZ9_THLAR|nr:unnamed protein product [Thlaspi arvense]
MREGERRCEAAVSVSVRLLCRYHSPPPAICCSYCLSSKLRPLHLVLLLVLLHHRAGIIDVAQVTSCCLLCRVLSPTVFIHSLPFIKPKIKGEGGIRGF